MPFLLEQETVFFVFANLLDLGMTVYLLSHPSSAFYESNPIARSILTEWGVPGLALFKFSLVAFVCSIAHYIACHKIRAARGLMTAATAIVTCVVIYSALLSVHTTMDLRILAQQFAF
ncbi:MAG: DUF5658 family protein [Planctomycetales bacterium]